MSTVQVATERMTKRPVGPTVVGSWWDERVRLAAGRWMRIDSRVTITPTSGGCLLSHCEVLRPRPLVRPWTRLLARQLGPRLAERLEDIRQVLEQADEDRA